MVTFVGSLFLVHLAVCRVLPAEEDYYYDDDGYYYNYYGDGDTQEGEVPPEHEHHHHDHAAAEPPYPVEVPVEETPQNVTEPHVHATVPAPAIPAAPLPHKIPSK